MLALQALVIIAGNLALIPITGITLPFISYGGSSILVNYLMIAMLLRLSMRGRATEAGREPSCLAERALRPGQTAPRRPRPGAGVLPVDGG